MKNLWRSPEMNGKEKKRKKRIVLLFMITFVILMGGIWLYIDTTPQRENQKIAAEDQVERLAGSEITFTLYQESSYTVQGVLNTNSATLTIKTNRSVSNARVPAYALDNCKVGDVDYRSNIKNVIITDNFNSIGNWAFYDYSNIISINIPNTVTSIGQSAFRSCSSLESLTLPSGITLLHRSLSENTARKRYLYLPMF